MAKPQVRVAEVLISLDGLAVVGNGSTRAGRVVTHGRAYDHLVNGWKYLGRKNIPRLNDEWITG
jgi:hypothetical protein